MCLGKCAWVFFSILMKSCSLQYKNAFFSHYAEMSKLKVLGLTLSYILFLIFFGAKFFDFEDEIQGQSRISNQNFFNRLSI